MSNARVTITAESVEAAHAQAARDMAEAHRPDRAEIRRILEAAAPHLVAFPMGMSQGEWEKHVESYR